MGGVQTSLKDTRNYPKGTMMTQISPLQKARASYQPKLPPVLRECGPFASAKAGAATESVADQAKIKERYPDTYGMPAISFEKGAPRATAPIKVAVILSGGQAPGGHNVIAGLFDGLKALNPANELFGFLGGPSGLIDDKYIMLDAAAIEPYRNTGGFDIICSGRTKLEKKEQFVKVAANCKKHGISAIVIIGGDDSNTNACALAQHMIEHNAGVQVIGCPKTIDGDLKNEWIEVSFGFDTATKVYCELIGNIMRDANSARKYWHFIKLMGRSASHIALECALQTHPTACIISEEVAAKGTSLKEIADSLTELVVKRAIAGMKFGVVLIPEGLVEFIPEMKELIQALNELLAGNEEFEALPGNDAKAAYIVKRLKPECVKTLESMPIAIRNELLGDRDPHGNVQVSRIETEKLLIAMVDERIKARNKAVGKEGFQVPFGTQSHFFGYEGRCAAPSNFDADYCYSLGYTASALIGAGRTGYMACVRNISRAASEWEAGGIPLTMMMNMERRNKNDVPVIRKALVELEAVPFKTFAANREEWGKGVDFVYPGPIQYFGPSEVCDRVTITLALEHA